MTNQEAADELQYAINLIKQDGKDWLDERDIPILEEAISALQAQDSPKPTAESVQNMQNEDLILRKAAIDAMGKAQWAKERLMELPSAQPEIIRCLDCKYWREHKYAKETKKYIPFCGFNAIYTKSDDFCSKAERRTDEPD